LNLGFRVQSRVGYGKTEGESVEEKSEEWDWSWMVLFTVQNLVIK
jgi:hypothetical protein